MGLATTTGMLLIVAVSLLTPMVPGGPIETRSFATLPRAVFWGFNAFLIMLGLGSIVTAVLVLGGGTWAYGIALGLGAGYVAVFGLDLAGVFPGRRILCRRRCSCWKSSISRSVPPCASPRCRGCCREDRPVTAAARNHD